MERRRFLAGGAGAVLTAAWAARGSGSMAAGAKGEGGVEIDAGEHANPRNAVNRHHFGVNYTPSHNWWYCWNDWKTGPIRQDLDRIAALGADHLRIMLIWPYFQPNPKWVSEAHLERLTQLLALMSERGLDALVTVFTGQLSGWRFLSPFNKPDPAIYADVAIWKAEELLIRKLARVMQAQENVIGFDLGNEMNTCWSAPLAGGDAWMARMFALMSAALPQCIHVNGVDHQPWFEPATFSARALAANPFPVIHAYPYWAKALRYGGPMDPPSTHILAAFAALVRSYANDAQKPVWAGEFNTCIESMPEKRQAEWLETAVMAGIEGGVSWFSYWDSHDVNRKFAFNSVEYSLGLLTNDGRVKEQGRVFKRLAETYRGKPVAFPGAAVPPPPAVQTFGATWQWLLDFLHWKPGNAAA
jgi:endo-1,4-beta-mannosidase